MGKVILYQARNINKTFNNKMAKALEIIFNKNVDMALFKWVERETYNLHFKDNNAKHLTKAEWDLLQDILDAFMESE